MALRRRAGKRAQERVTGNHKRKGIMRVIDLGNDHEKAKARFTIMHTAATQGNGADGLDGLRQLTKVQDALDEVSDEESQSVDGQRVVVRTLKSGVSQIVLEDAP